MTPLRQQMITAMQQRGFSPRTHQSYLVAIYDLARYTHRSPAELSPTDLQHYFTYLACERKLSGASCRLYLHAVRFLYLQVLHWSEIDVALVVPKRAQRIPELLTRAEVGQILAACNNPKHFLLLALCYGCGLRVSEVVSIRCRHIDTERQLLRIEQGKGAKDRVVILPPRLLAALERYQLRHRLSDWLFPGRKSTTGTLSITTAQKAFQRAKALTGITKLGGIHSLRHAYATHQLESGLPIHQLQRLLGHRNIQSTLRYVHWSPSAQRDVTHYSDLLESLEVDHG